MQVVLGFASPLVNNDQSLGKIAGGSPIPVGEYNVSGNGMFKFGFEWEMECSPTFSLTDVATFNPKYVERIAQITGKLGFSLDAECFPHQEGSSNVVLHVYDSEKVVKKICRKFGGDRNVCSVNVDIKYLDKIMTFKEGVFHQGTESCAFDLKYVPAMNLMELVSSKITFDTFQAYVYIEFDKA